MSSSWSVLQEKRFFVMVLKNLVVFSYNIFHQLIECLEDYYFGSFCSSLWILSLMNHFYIVSLSWFTEKYFIGALCCFILTGLLSRDYSPAFNKKLSLCLLSSRASGSLFLSFQSHLCRSILMTSYLIHGGN